MIFEVFTMSAIALMLSLLVSPLPQDSANTTPANTVAAAPNAAAAPASATPPATTETLPTAPAAPGETQPTAPGSPPNTTQTVSLRYQFTPGQVLRYRSEQKMTLEAQLGQSRRVDVSEVKQTRKFTVQDVRTSGDAELSMQFEHVWMRKQVDGGEPLDFDSSMKSSEVPETFRGVAHSLRGTAPKFFLTPLGQTAVRSDVRQAVAENRPSLPSPVEHSDDGESPKTVAAPVQQASAGNGSQPKDPGSFLMLLSATPVKVGDTWKEEIPLTVRAGVDSTLQVTILRTYRLDKLSDDNAHVSFRSSLRSPSRSTVIHSQLIQATPSGSFVFDVRRGIMLSREFRYSETVIGALGAESLLSSFGTQTEVLLPNEQTP